MELESVLVAVIFVVAALQLTYEWRLYRSRIGAIADDQMWLQWHERIEDEAHGPQ